MIDFFVTIYPHKASTLYLTTISISLNMLLHNEQQPSCSSCSKCIHSNAPIVCQKYQITYLPIRYPQKVSKRLPTTDSTKNRIFLIYHKIITVLNFYSPFISIVNITAMEHTDYRETQLRISN